MTQNTIQILGVLFQTFGTILGITTAFYLYLLQKYQGKFLSYDGEEKRFHFESPTIHFWLFFMFTVGMMIIQLFLMFAKSSQLFPAQRIDTIVILCLVLSGIDLVCFGWVVKEFATYQAKRRRFMRFFTVVETDCGFMIRKKE